MAPCLCSPMEGDCTAICYILSSEHCGAGRWQYVARVICWPLGCGLPTKSTCTNEMTVWLSSLVVYWDLSAYQVNLR
jgi:hypothetical protein